MITLKNIKKTYASKKGSEFTLNIDSLSVNKGEYVSLIGPDGAGKSTLIKIICGLTPFDSGEVTVAGFRLPEEFNTVRLRIGYLSQTFTLYRNLSVYENVDYFASLFEVKEKREKITELLGATGLIQFKDRLSKDLSGGMKQKLSIACALVRSPELLILDEPTTGVDPRSRREIFRIIEERLFQKMTVLFSTSYMDEAERAERVIMLSQGKVIGDYKTQDIMQKEGYKSVEEFYISRINR